MKKTICAVIAVKNEQKNIARCLNSLSNVVDHILVVDSASQDDTVVIAEGYGAEVIQFKKNNGYPKKRQFALNSLCDNFDYAMLIDADEVISDMLANEIREILNGKSDASVFFARKSFHFLGKRLKYGGFDFFAAFVVKPSLVKFEDLGEVVQNGLDMEVHEHPIISGKIDKIEARIDHIDRAYISKMYSRHLEYAKWEVERSSVIKRKENSSYTIRQKIKYRNFDKFYFSYMYFLVDYVLLGRFIDGYSGLKYSLLKFWYFNEIKRILDDK